MGAFTCEGSKTSEALSNAFPLFMYRLLLSGSLALNASPGVRTVKLLMS